MLTEEQARTAVETEYSGTVAKKVWNYKELFLVRVEFDDPDEANYDPFFTVDPETGKVAEFSIIRDGDPDILATLTAEGG